MAELILSIIKEGLPILDKLIPDEATKIRNLILDYERKWDAEISKGEHRDDALLDMYTRELLDIGRLFSAALGQATFKS
jgi:hypothetical protein